MCARALKILSSLILLSSPILAGDLPDLPDPSAAGIDWLALDGTSMGVTALADPESSADASPIEAEVWRERLPDGAISLVDGGSVPFADPDRGALLLDFWATWCAPCREELPQIDALYRHHREAGLEVVAVNVDETAEVAAEFARSLDVEIPIALAKPALVRRLGVETLPVLIMADRQGNVLKRWNRYTPGVAREAGARFESEREREIVPAARFEIGRFEGGSHRPRVSWSRNTGAPALGVEATVTSAGSSLVAVVVERGLILLELDGRVRLQQKTAPFGGRLEFDATVGLVAHREGSTRALSLGREGAERLVGIGAPLLDLAVDGRGRGAAATLDGLFLFAVDDPYGGSVERVEGVELASAVERVGEDWSVLAPGKLLTIAADRTVTTVTTVGEDAWSLVGADDRVGVAPELVLAHAAGRFVEQGQPIAIALRDGRLLLVDAADGRILARCRFDEVADLGVVDVDGDGVDELLIAHGARVSLLSWE